MNEESLIRALCGISSGPVVVVLYAPSHEASQEVVELTRGLLTDFNNVQLVCIDVEEHRTIQNLPIFNGGSLGSVHFFLNGRPYCSPLQDAYQVADRLRRLGISTLEEDPFDAVGTTITSSSDGASLKWRKESSVESRRADSVSSAVNPFLLILDALSDV